MADVMWIKLATDIFDNRKIKQIEKMPDGDSIIVIWIKILCLAGHVNDSGLIYLTKEIPYTEEMLATEFNRPLPIVRLALTTFQRFGMVEIVDDIYHVSSWEKYQNVAELEKIREQTRKRVARYRENKLLEIRNQKCVYCGSQATGYDHIIALARGGTDTDENMVPCCIDCNKIKNDKPLVDFLNSYRARIDDDSVCNNEKLKRYVTLSNVTNRYIVTQGNATEKIREEKKREDIEKKGKKEKPSASYEVILSSYDLDDDLKDTLREFIKMRKLTKSPLTDHALDLLVRKLLNMSDDNEIRIAILNQSIESSWKGIFPLKDEKQKRNRVADDLEESYKMMKEWADNE